MKETENLVSASINSSSSTSSEPSGVRRKKLLKTFVQLPRAGIDVVEIDISTPVVVIGDIQGHSIGLPKPSLQLLGNGTGILIAGGDWNANDSREPVHPNRKVDDEISSALEHRCRVNSHQDG